MSCVFGGKSAESDSLVAVVQLSVATPPTSQHLCRYFRHLIAMCACDTSLNNFTRYSELAAIYRQDLKGAFYKKDLISLINPISSEI
ncbi:hypothetical protein TcasGA2_TC003579 [Tribolium castaneum]|uniref:Uncharacterized protein n=1 Tax=Tribolium castaneum TaxID=7070 RepID=D6WHV3_TRICA|nr:hypothetical protein TcasGA2_TC003579 [Tribolium castaneum]